MVTGGVGVGQKAVKLVQGVILAALGGAWHKTVRVMVGHKGDDRIIGNTGFLKLRDKALKGILQLLIAGIIGLDRVGIGHIVRYVLILHGHIVDFLAESVACVAADGHVINAEGLLVDILGQGDVYHLKVTGGEAATELKAVSVSLLVRINCMKQ